MKTKILRQVINQPNKQEEKEVEYNAAAESLAQGLNQYYNQLKETITKQNELRKNLITLATRRVMLHEACIEMLHSLNRLKRDGLVPLNDFEIDDATLDAIMCAVLEK